jgi:predicted O-methyltransferase YrrM
MKEPENVLGLTTAYLLRKGKLSKLTKLPIETINAFLKELEKEPTPHIKKEFSNQKHSAVDPVSVFGSFKGAISYVVCRALKPDAIVETGVKDGVSTTYILTALKLNNKGHLYSIDLRDPVLPKDFRTGWIVPENLKNRWSLIGGKSSEQIPPLLKRLNQIDVFQHDSEHSYENMLFEYETAWKHIREGGVLLSDDIRMNDAWRDFNKNRTSVYSFYSFGAAAKR